PPRAARHPRARHHARRHAGHRWHAGARFPHRRRHAGGSAVMTSGVATRVLLADDHNLVRAGVRKILEAHREVEVVGEVGDGDAALRALARTPTDVLVLDLTMPGADGFEVLRRAKHQHPDLKVLVLTMHASPEYVARAIREGVDGYLLKDSAVQDLVAA